MKGEGMRLALGVLLAGLLLAAGEARANGDDAGPWLRGLYGKKRVTHGDVLLAAALLTDDRTWHEDPAWALKVCDRHGNLRCKPPRGINAHSRRGWAASVFARTLDIDGGLWGLIFDQQQRYAYRELVVLGLLPPGGENTPLDGDELAGLLLAAERYRKNGPERLPQRGVAP